MGMQSNTDWCLSPDLVGYLPSRTRESDRQLARAGMTWLRSVGPKRHLLSRPSKEKPYAEMPFGCFGTCARAWISAAQQQRSKRSPTSSSSWATTSAWNIGAYHQGMMAGPNAEPRPARRRGHALHRLLRRGELHGGPRQLHHRRAADPHRPDHRRPGRLADRHAGARRRPSPRRSSRWATPPASSARTTWAT